MIIKSLEIENFKKFGALSVSLQSLDCLVGGNNSGKSTMLQALALFDFCLHQCLSKINGKPITLKNRSIPEEEFVVLPTTRGADLWHNRSVRAKNKFVVIKIIVTFDNGRKVQTTLDFNFNRFALATETEPDEVWLNELHKFKISYLPVFSSFQTKEERRTQLAIRNELGRGNVNAVIRNLLLSLKEEKREKELIDLLRRAFPSIEKLDIVFDEASMQFISVTYTEKGQKRELDVFSAGSGFQQFIYLFGFILLEQPNVILLDEPDVHLHGQLQKALLDELGRLLDNHRQVLFATHSRDLISSVKPENIINLHDGKAQRLAIDYEVYNMLDNLGSLENIQLIAIQEFKRVLLVENYEDWEAIQYFGRLVLGEVAMSELIKRLAVCYAHGNPTKQDVPKFRQSLQDLFTGKGSGAVKLFVVADRDYFPFPEQLSKELENKEKKFTNSAQNHIFWHIWHRNELENYLVEKSLLLRLIFPNKNPQATLEEASLFRRFDELIQEQADEIEGRFMKGFEEYSRLFKKNWDSTYCLREGKQKMRTEWQAGQQLHWIDAKKLVSGLAGWLQKNSGPVISRKKLLEAMTPTDLVLEVKEMVHLLADFVGLDSANSISPKPARIKGSNI